MKISTKGRYAIRVILDIAMHDDGKYIPLKDIAKRQDLTVKYLEQIISLLNKAGYLQSLRGNAGGYRLSKKPEECIIGDILRITEGDLAPIPCLKDEINNCSRANECITLPFWQGLDKVIKYYVESVTIQDLIDHANMQVNNYSI